MWLRPGERPEVAFAVQLQCNVADLHAGDLLDIEPVDVPTTGNVLARDTDEARPKEDQQEWVEAVAPTLTRPKVDASDKTQTTLRVIAHVGIANPGREPHSVRLSLIVQAEYI